MKYTWTESTVGGTILYKANHLTYKPRIDLNFCKTNELESILTELINMKITKCFNWPYSQGSFYEPRWVLKDIISTLSWKKKLRKHKSFSSW